MQITSQNDNATETGSEGFDLDSINKIPFQLGGMLIIKPGSNPAQTLKVKVVGAMENGFILAERRTLEADDRLTTPIDGDASCSYLCEGILYKFRSNFHAPPFQNVVCLQYPSAFEPIQVRRYRRVKVNLEAESKKVEDEEIFNGEIKDISDGGCLVELAGLVKMLKGDMMEITFMLPDNQLVDGLQCTVVNVRYFDELQKTRFGLSFVEPETEIRKVREFCEMCLYLKV